jgi:hypothetical protein
MNSWVLVIAMFSPGGDYMDKIPVPVPNKVACEQARSELPIHGEDPFGIQYKAVCVTREHWEGKKPMKRVPLD